MKNTILAILFLCVTSWGVGQNQVIVPINGKGYSDRGDWTTTSSTFSLEHRATGTEGCIAQFTPKLPKAGKYKISFLGTPVNYTVNVVIYHNGKRENLTFTSNTSHSVNTNYLVGSSSGYEFDATGREFVALYVTYNSSWARIRGVVFDLVSEMNVAPPTTYADSLYYSRNEGDQVEVTASPGFKVITSGWKFSCDPLGPVAGEPKILYSTSTSEQAVEWRPEITHTGANAWVKIYAYTPFSPRDESAGSLKYELYFPSQPYKNNSKQFYSNNRSEWQHLGDYQFSGNGDEYIRLVRSAGTSANYPTRISCIKYELWAPGQGGENILWQTMYVNANDPTIPVVVPSVDLTDMVGNPVKYFIEQLCNKDLVEYDKVNKTFSPMTAVTTKGFVDMIERAVKKQTNDSRILNCVAELKSKYASVIDQPQRYQAVSILVNELIPEWPQNREWIDATVADMSRYGDYMTVFRNTTWRSLYSVATRQGLLNRFYYTKFEPTALLNKEYAAMLIKGLFDVYFWSLPPIKYNWTLRYQDEFDDSVSFWKRWVSENGCPGHITSGRFPANLSVADGKMKILVKNEIPAKTCPDGKSVDWTTGSAGDQTFRQRYGYWEARYKYIDATSLNQSFWMNAGHGFEIDINEGHWPNKVNTTLHYQDKDKPYSNGNSNTVSDDLSKDFHTYACHWRPDSIFFYLDNNLLVKKKSFNAQQPVFPIFSLAILPWAGPVKQEMSGKTMDVEWVRIYTANQDISILTGMQMDLTVGGEAQPITVQYKDEAGIIQVGRTIRFKTKRLNDALVSIVGDSEVITDSQGKATIMVKGGRFAGKSQIEILVENSDPVFIDITVQGNGESCLPIPK